MQTPEHQTAIARIMVEAEADGRGLLEAMCRAADPDTWDRPLEALEMYAEARSFLEEELGELVDRMRTWHEPPFSWDEIAQRLGVSRQAAWKKYGTSDDGATRLRQRPGPLGREDVATFDFNVGDSYLKRGELTIPVRFNAMLNERLPGNGPSWSASIHSGEVRDHIKIRRGHTSGTRYYQIRVPNDTRARIGLPKDHATEVSIYLIGKLVVTLK